MVGAKDLAKLAAALGGLPVIGCRRDSPAARAGVTYGDIVLSVNGMPTPDWSSFIEARSRSSTSMVVELFRDGEQLRLEFALDQTTVIDPPQLVGELLADRIIGFPVKPDPPEPPN